MHGETATCGVIHTLSAPPARPRLRAGTSGEPLRVIRPPTGLEEGELWSFPDASGQWTRYQDQQGTRLWDLGGWPQSRPLILRRGGSRFAIQAAFHPEGKWLVETTNARKHLTFWPLEGFPVWNVADSAVTVGTIVLLLLMLLEERREAAAKRAAEPGQ